jgi:hypothetical protein
VHPRVAAGNFSRIIVYDRASHRLVEEQISATLVLAMRNMYQSKVENRPASVRSVVATPCSFGPTRTHYWVW